MKKGAISFEKWCENEGKPSLLALYDKEANPLPASEIPFSSPKKYQFRCPVCHISWEQATNKVNRLKEGHYNYIKKRKEITFCPYCKGERPSVYYNMLTDLPEISKWWDYERNVFRPETYLPYTHQKFYLKCPQCQYHFPKPIRIKDLHGTFRCPDCGDGKNREVTPFNNLAALYPEISAQLDDARNNGITGEMILPSYKEKLWFICPHGHRYNARVSNRTYLNRGCSICAKRKKTSFAEQAFRYYLQKCDPNIKSGQIEQFTGKSVDILMPSCKTAIEFNSCYYHTTIKEGQRIAADQTKICLLAQYYRVYIVQEEGNILHLPEHPLIEMISVPVFEMTDKICRDYDQAIYQLLRKLFPVRDTYPNINIMRDQLQILQQYINTAVDGSFEEKYPLLAADWHPSRNGHLTPGMFLPGTPYKFYWICRTCKKTYRKSMGNRIKGKTDTCPLLMNVVFYIRLRL